MDSRRLSIMFTSDIASKTQQFEGGGITELELVVTEVFHITYVKWQSGGVAWATGPEACPVVEFNQSITISIGKGLQTVKGYKW